MDHPPLTVASTASAVRALRKSALGLKNSLSELGYNSQITDNVINLAAQVQLLANECDHVFSELEPFCKNNRGVSSRNGFDDTAWHYIAMLVEEARQTTQELEHLVQSIKGGESSFNPGNRGQRSLEGSRFHLVNISVRIHRHINVLRTVFLLITALTALEAPLRPDRPHYQNLHELESAIRFLQQPLDPNHPPVVSYSETALIQCAKAIIAKGTANLAANPTANYLIGSSSMPNISARPTEWGHPQESVHVKQKHSTSSNTTSWGHSHLSSDRKDAALAQQGSMRRDLRDSKFGNEMEDHDLEIDLVRAALETGNKAFEAQEWKEAESLLQEALKILQSLPSQQCSLFNIFDLHYKLAVCTYYAQDTATAQEALTGLIHQPASTDEQFECIYTATHLLSQLYIRMGQIDQARLECEKAFKARRRLLGKQSDASLESMALMAHIYVLLNNRALAKSYLAMIPEECRDSVIEAVEKSLGTEIEHLDFPNLLKEKSPETPNPASLSPRSGLSTSTGESPNPQLSNCSQVTPGNFSSVHHRQDSRYALYNPSASQSVSTFYHESTDQVGRGGFIERERPIEPRSISGTAVDTVSLHPVVSQEAKSANSKVLSRKEILDKIGCQPRDRIEEAVCNGDQSSLTNLLNKKANSWRSKIRKHAHSERVTALHFAALFGEINMARVLVSANFNVNEVPYGYSTRLTPLTFAIGARQVDMVQFLIASGARPSEPDTWSTLASQLLSRSWLMKTMSGVEKEYVPSRIIAILGVLLRHGWDINAPYETSGKTLLHQAVTFWTGSYNWDLMLRAAISSFLCENGANPFQADAEGHTPFDKATANGDQDLLRILGQHPGRLNRQSQQSEFAELAGSSTF